MANFNNNNTRGNNRRREPAKPDEMQLKLADMLMAQISEYDNSEETDHKARNMKLFYMDSFTMDMGNDMRAYVMERNLKIDRETGAMTRASVSIVVTDEREFIPVYFATAYVNANTARGFVGGVSVTPWKHGPQRFNTYRAAYNKNKAE